MFDVILKQWTTMATDIALWLQISCETLLTLQQYLEQYGPSLSKPSSPHIRRNHHERSSPSDS